MGTHECGLHNRTFALFLRLIAGVRMGRTSDVFEFAFRLVN